MYVCMSVCLSVCLCLSDCLLNFTFSLPSKPIQERKEKFVSKFACCHNLLWHFGIDFIKLRLFFFIYFLICMLFFVLLCYHL